MTLDDEQRAFAAAIGDYSKREGAEARRRALGAGSGGYDRQTHQELAELGWMGAAIDERFGGAGGGRSTACVLLGEAMRGGLPLLALASTLVVADIIQAVGDDVQKQAILGGICAGEVASIAMSEPEAGSDVAALRCSATTDGETFLIDGHKTWISAAHVASHVLAIVRTDAGERKHQGLSMLWVPLDHEGIEVRPIDTLAGRDVNDVFFTGCAVPATALVGERGRAWAQLMSALDLERVLIAAAMLGLARAAFDDARAYVGQRHQFGRPIGSFQVIRHRLADMAVEIECCSLLVGEAMRALDDPDDTATSRKAAFAKLKASEMVKQVTLEGMQMMGGSGYATDSEMQHRVRMALGSTIYGGTSEIQREIIARSYV